LENSPPHKIEKGVAPNRLIVSDQVMFMGVAAIRWRFVDNNDALEYEELPALLGSLDARYKTHGFIVYEAESFMQCQAELTDPIHEPARLRHYVKDIVCAAGTLGDVLGEWTQSLTAKPGLFPIVLHPGLALAILTGASKVVHATPIYAKTVISRSFGDHPSKRDLQYFRGNFAAVYRSFFTQQAKVTQTSNNGIDPHLVVDWIRATRGSKQVRLSKTTASDWAKLFTRRLTLQAEDLLAEEDQCSRELVRLGRVRLDICCMWLWRQFWMGLYRLDPACDVYLYTDASPQRRGIEFFATSFDLYVGESLFKRIFPCVQPVAVTAFGKAISMLWQIFLMFGPGYEQVKAYCRRVLSILTDLGVERFLVAYPDILNRFYELIGFGNSIPVEFRKEVLGAKLFPRAIAMAGWRHLWDWLLQKCLTAMSFFPAWLKKLKVVVSDLWDEIISKPMAPRVSSNPAHAQNRGWFLDHGFIKLLGKIGLHFSLQSEPQTVLFFEYFLKRQSASPQKTKNGKT